MWSSADRLPLDVLFLVAAVVIIVHRHLPGRSIHLPGSLHANEMPVIFCAFFIHKKCFLNCAFDIFVDNKGPFKSYVTQMGVGDVKFAGKQRRSKVQRY